MSPTLIDLNRQPCRQPTTPDGDQSEAAIAEAFELGFAPEDTWDKLLEHRVVLLTGPAHCGKSSELTLLQQRRRAAAKVCFMLDLSTLFRCSVGESLKADRAVFEAWLDDETEAVFLLDALDEAELCDDRALLMCIGKLASSLGAPGLLRSRFVVSSRPGSWSSASVLDNIRYALCQPAPRTSAVAGAEAELVADVSEDGAVFPDEQLVFASLPPLTKSQVSLLLRKRHGIAQPAALQAKAQELGLGFALRSPGSMAWLASVIPKLSKGDSRYKAYEMAVSELIRMGFANRRIAATASEVEVTEEVEGLCAASFFCQTDLFALRGAASDVGAVSLREALAHRPAGFETLVQTFPFFIDSGYERIKLMPAELRQFLTARWLKKRIDGNEMSVTEVVKLFVVDSFDGPLVPSQFEVTAGWVASMNDEFCREIIDLAPHAVLLYGDLSLLTTALAHHALERTIEGLSQGKPLLYRSVRLTSDDYWQAVRPDLVERLILALNQQGQSGAAWSLLTHLVASRQCAGAVEPMKRMVTSPRVPDSTLERAVDVIGDCGVASELEWAVDALFSLGRFNERVATVVLQSLMARSTSLSHFKRVLGSGLAGAHSSAWFAEDLMEHLASKQEAKALILILKQASDGLADKAASTATMILAEAIEGFLKRDDVSNSDFELVLDVLEFLRVSDPDSHRFQFDDIRPLIRKRPSLQELAVRRLVPVVGGERAWQLMNDNQHDLYATVDCDDIRLLQSIRRECCNTELELGLDDLIKTLHSRCGGAPPAPARPVAPKAQKALPGDREAIESRIAEIEAGTNPALMAGLARALTGGRPRTVLDNENWKELARQYGEPVCQAARAGFRKFWRQHPPREDVNRPGLMYYETIAGLIGLGAELMDRLTVKELSSIEVAQALRYSLFEWYPPPPWLAHLIDCYPIECDSFFATVVASWASSPAAAGHARRVLTGLPIAHAIVGPQYRSAVWAYLKAGCCTERHEVEQALSVLYSTPDHKAITPFLKTTAMKLWRGGLENFEVYFTAWVHLDPTAALGFLAKTAQRTDQHGRIIKLAAYWSRRKANPIEVGDSDSRTVADQLETLYVAMTIAVPPKTDPYHVGVHSPDTRDAAGSFRSSILEAITSIGGHAAYTTFKRLAQRYRADQPLSHTLNTMAATVAENNALPSPWTTGEFVAFAKDASSTPVSDEHSLWRRVRRDARVAVENAANGQFHVSELLKEGQERDMQLWLARELQLLSRRAYSVHREEEQADRTEPDIRIRTPAHMVTLELKVADGRTAESLLHDLEKQLKEDYLRDKASNFGVFVVMSKGRQTIYPYKGQRLSFGELGQLLETRAKEITASTFGKKHVEVITFQCPLGHSPRNTPKKVATKRPAESLTTEGSAKGDALVARILRIAARQS